MRMLKLGLAAAAALAFNATAQAQTILPSNGMGDGRDGTITPPSGVYQAPVVGTAPNNQAFHAGGVAACDGCHVMHNASSGVAKSTISGGQSVAPWTNVTNAYLLQGSDQSSTCLICHAGANVAGVQFTIYDRDAVTNSYAQNFTPGGDFGWTRLGERRGHNVVAADFGMTADVRMTTAAGGSYTPGTGRQAFHCSSCHDPHGRYRMQVDAAKPNGLGFAGPYATSPATLPIAASGSYGEAPTATYAVGAYRLLAGQYYAPASNTSVVFANDPPVAVAPQTYNAAETTDEVRVSYGTGMSEWCQNCHTSIHMTGYNTGVAGLRHPAGSTATLRASQINVYNTYISSGVVDPASTDQYTSLVPFEQGQSATLVSLAGRANPSSTIPADLNSAVMCLSCHRAHGTAFESMVRWDQNATFLTNATAFAPTGTRDAAQTRYGYYLRNVGPAANEIGAYQRSLCNKCHGKD